MHFPKLYKGTHLAVPNISVRRAARVEISPLGGEVLLDVDGEQLGVLPATFTVRVEPALRPPPDSAATPAPARHRRGSSHPG